MCEVSEPTQEGRLSRRYGVDSSGGALGPSGGRVLFALKLQKAKKRVRASDLEKICCGCLHRPIQAPKITGWQLFQPGCCRSFFFVEGQNLSRVEQSPHANDDNSNPVHFGAVHWM